MSAVSRDSDANLSVDEDEKDFNKLGLSAHRCSMIKRYNLDSYFFAPSPRQISNTEVKSNSKHVT